MAGRQVEATEGDICSGETACQGTGVVGLRSRYSLRFDFRRPEGIDGFSLTNAISR